MASFLSDKQRNAGAAVVLMLKDGHDHRLWLAAAAGLETVTFKSYIGHSQNVIDRKAGVTY